MQEEHLRQLIYRIEKLEKAVFGDNLLKKHSGNAENKLDLNFNLNQRAFVSRFAAGKSGPKKFVLMVAYLAKGKQTDSIKLVKIKEVWEKMKAKSLLGKFNDFYPNSATTKGWVNSRDHGSYNLTEEWKDVIK